MPKNGKVGQETYVGSSQVLGVTASEVRNDDDRPGLVLERGSFAIEATGSAGVTYGQLAALVDQLQGLR